MRALLDREHLPKLLGLLGSWHDGESLTADRRADAIVRRTALTLRDVLLDTLPQVTTVGFRSVNDLTICLQHRHILTEWEARFVVSTRQHRFPPTTHKHKFLTRIVHKLPAEAA